MICLNYQLKKFKGGYSNGSVSWYVSLTRDTICFKISGTSRNFSDISLSHDSGIFIFREISGFAKKSGWSIKPICGWCLQRQKYNLS